MGRLLLTCLTLFALVASTRTALADDATEQAKARYVAANKHYELGEYKQALAEYREAYRLKKLPGFLFNIAQCHRKLNQYQQAINMYQSYLTELPDAPNRKVVLELIEESRTRREQQRQSEAERRRAEAERRAAENARLQTEREQAERRRAQEREQLEEQRRREKLYDRHPARKWALGGMGLAGVTLGAGAVFAVRSRGDQSSFDDAGCGNVDRPLTSAEIARCEKHQNDGERNALVRNILLGSGMAIAAASTAVLILDPGNVARPRQSERPTKNARVSITPTSVSVSIFW